MVSEIIIPARGGRSVTLKAGQLLEITNVEGQQICDFVAFNVNDVSEFLSPSHTRAFLRRATPKVGDQLLSVRRRPMFEMIADTLGQHDMLIPACDADFYRLRFGEPDHPSCRTNLANAVSDYGISEAFLPDPVNFFQNTSVGSDGSISTGPSSAKPGDHVVLRAFIDMIAVGSACPMDRYGINGDRITDIAFSVRDA